MMIRAYRMRGHLHADLDPLQMKAAERRLSRAQPNQLRLHRSRPRPARSSSINVLGLEFATMPEMLDILQAHLLLDAWRRVHAHLRCRREILGPAAHRGAGQGIAFTENGKKAILRKLIEAEGFEKFHRRQIHRHQAVRP
jgi:2-oxoglutarate dehydrogenase E1 component